MAYAVFESTNMKSTHFAERIFDAKNIDADIENGTFGYLSVPAGTDYDYDIKKFNAGTSAGEAVVVADNPEWNEDMLNAGRTAKLRRDEYVNKKGVPFRARVIGKNDKFAVTIDAFTSATQTVVTGASKVEGIYVTIDSTTGKLVAAASAPSGTPVMVGVIQKARICGTAIATTAHNYGHATTLYEILVTKLA